MNLKIGVVENNVDPLKLGRCQVRIFGFHTEVRTDYPTTDLPWCTFISNSSNISGEGNFFIPNNGDYVAISFFDPEEQKPVILGVIPKFVESLPDFDTGFSDPNEVNPDSNFTDESGISRLARNENITDTIIQDKKDDRTTGVQCNSVSWDEPETLYDTEYPHNKVIHTQHHVIELDDTSSKERVHIFHKSGTSKEIHPNGDEVNLIKSNRYAVIDSDNNILVKGNYNVRVETNQNKEIGGHENNKVGGDRIVDVGQNSTENVDGNKLVDVDGSAKMDAGTAAEVKGGTTAKLTAGTTAEVTGTTINVSSSGAVNISAGGAVTITGATIALN